MNPAPVPVDQTARCRDDGAGPPGQWAARQPRATVRTQNIRNHVAPSPAAAAAAASPGPPPGSWPAEPPPAYPGMGPVYLAQPMGTPVAVVGMDWWWFIMGVLVVVVGDSLKCVDLLRW